jgi:glyoxylase-like metal-dependent hydrolase (beta-lactamase superfamily II)
MNIYSIDAGHFKLDGGAMFGVVPKTLWSRHSQADENNLCNWEMRCLLVEDSNRLTLIDTGMGDKQDPRWQGFYHRNGEGDLVKSIQKAGFSPNDITDVILSHLHFDHAGGAVSWNSDRTKFVMTFPNAKYWTASQHWALSQNSNPREGASFLKENLLPMQESGQLYFVDKEPVNPFNNIDIMYANGHTEQMMMPVVNYNGKKIVFMADLLPSVAHIPIVWVMGYDSRPVETMKEKESLLATAANDEYILFFDHDPVNDCCIVEKTEKGIKAKAAGLLRDFI